MKTDWPAPHNPENRTLAPGYRWIGRKETPNPKTDETTRYGGNDSTWNRLDQMPDTDWAKHSHKWSIRRALCVDDPSTPPPDQWTDGYVIEAVPAGYPSRGTECWHVVGVYPPRWIKPSSPDFPWANACYIRRPLGAPVAPYQPTHDDNKLCLKPGQSIIVKVGNVFPLSDGAVPLSRAVQQIAFNAGWSWGDPENPDDLKPRDYTGYIVLSNGPRADNRTLTYTDNERWIERNHKDAVRLDARTDLGKLIDLLNSLKTPPLVGPMINGHVGVYVKGDTCIRFGCAQISLMLLREMGAHMGLSYHTGQPYPGNRTIRAITLDSVVSITKDDIKAILAYEEAVDKAS